MHALCCCCFFLNCTSCIMGSWHICARSPYSCTGLQVHACHAPHALMVCRSFDVMLENFTDPAHVPHSHHGVIVSIRNTCMKWNANSFIHSCDQPYIWFLSFAHKHTTHMHCDPLQLRVSLLLTRQCFCAADDRQQQLLA